MNRRLMAAGAVLALVGPGGGRVTAQMPGVDIYMAMLTADSAGALTIGQARNLTARAGYDNQPSFGPEGTWFFFSRGDSTGTDVYRCEIATGEIIRVTSTPESEFSPTVMLSGDAFSAVRIEADGFTQRLWRFDMDGGNPAPVIADVDSVGYHCWLDEHTLALFVVGAPHTLRVVDLREGTELEIARDVGRSLSVWPGSNELLFAARSTDGNWIFQRLRRPSLDIVPAFPLLSQSQDCAWLSGTSLVMGLGDTLYRRDISGGTWTPVGQFAGLDAISRLAVSPDGKVLLFVASDGPATDR